MMHMLVLLVIMVRSSMQNKGEILYNTTCNNILCVGG